MLVIGGICSEKTVQQQDFIFGPHDLLHDREPLRVRAIAMRCDASSPDFQCSTRLVWGWFPRHSDSRIAARCIASGPKRARTTSTDWLSRSRRALVSSCGSNNVGCH